MEPEIATSQLTSLCIVHPRRVMPRSQTNNSSRPRPRPSRLDIAEFMQPNHALPAPAWGSLLISSDPSWTYLGGGTTPKCPIGALLGELAEAGRV